MPSSYPPLRINNIVKKIHETERRLDCFLKWNAPDNLKQSRSQCMGALQHTLKFLRKRQKTMQHTTLRLKTNLEKE